LQPQAEEGWHNVLLHWPLAMLISRGVLGFSKGGTVGNQREQAMQESSWWLEDFLTYLFESRVQQQPLCRCHALV
jgi:hypothetical protein